MVYCQQNEWFCKIINSFSFEKKKMRQHFKFGPGAIWPNEINFGNFLGRLLVAWIEENYGSMLDKATGPISVVDQSVIWYSESCTNQIFWNFL